MIQAVHRVLNEGGNIFKDPEGNPATTRINKADVKPTLAWLEKITKLDHRNHMLGTTGVKDTSGDLDVAIDKEKVDIIANFIPEATIFGNKSGKLLVLECAIVTVHDSFKSS